MVGRGLVARVGWGLALLGGGCTAGEPAGTMGFGPGPWMLPGDSGDDSPATSGGTGQTSTDDDGAATSGGSSSGSPPGTSGPPPPPPGSTGMDDAATFGGVDEGGQQPDSGWWSHCTSTIGCDSGLACLTTDAGNDGVCTALCSPAGSPTGCGSSPGGTTMPVCLSVGGQSICALGCEGGLTCPGGMICVSETDDTGPISICI